MPPKKKTSSKAKKSQPVPSNRKKTGRKSGKTPPTASPNKTPKWQVVENVVAAIERVRAAIPGVEITQKVQIPKAAFPDQTRDVDVLVEIPVQGRKFRMGIEVKNEGRPIAEDELGTLVDLKNDLHLDRYCVVSTSGYTATAHQKAAQNGIELSTLSPSDGSPFFGAPSGELVTTRHVQVISVNAYGPSDVLAKIQGVRANVLKVVAQGVAKTLDQAIVGSAHRAVTEGHAKDQNGEELRFCQRLDPACHLITQDGSQIAPVDFDVHVRFVHVKVEDLRFTLGGLQICTWETDGPQGRLQLTTVGEPTAEDPRKYRIHLTSGPAKPPKKRVEPNCTRHAIVATDSTAS